MLFKRSLKFYQPMKLLGFYKVELFSVLLPSIPSKMLKSVDHFIFQNQKLKTHFSETVCGSLQDKLD